MKICVGVGPYSNVVLNVNVEDERLYREAGIHAGKVYDNLALRYPQKSEEELWMLTAYSMTVEYGKALLRASESPLMTAANDCIADIDRMLEENGM